MSEQPTEIANDSNEGVDVTNSNTLNAKQRREQAAQQLGISYDDSLKMSQSELDKRVADPNFEQKEQQKELFLSAQSTIHDMQKEPMQDTQATQEMPSVDNLKNEIEEVATPSIDVEDESSISKLETAQLKISAILYDRVGRLFDKYKNLDQSKKRQFQLGAASLFATYIATRYIGLTGNGNIAHASEINDLNQGGVGATPETSGVTGSTGATSEVTNGTGGASYQEKASLPVFGEIDTNKSTTTDADSDKFASHYSDKNHKGNQVNSFGGTERGIVEKADYGILSGDYLDRYIDTHDRMTAGNVEKLVNVRFQEKYGLDADKFNSDWGIKERENMKREYLSDSGHSLSEAGQRAHRLHLEELQEGKTIKVTAEEAASKYGLNINSWMTEGDLKGGIDDKAFAAGATHDDIYITFDENGNIKHAEIGECGNEVFIGSEKLESIPSTELNTPTVDRHIAKINPPEWPKEHLEPKKPEEDINANPNLNEQLKVDEQVPAGEQKPATEPGPTYTPPEVPAPPTTERPEPAPAVEAPAPTPEKPATGPVTPLK